MSSYDHLISQFLVVTAGFFDPVVVDPIHPQNRQIVRNYRSRPLVNAIFSRVNGLWATGPGVHCVACHEIPDVWLYMKDGEVSIDIQSPAIWKRLFAQIEQFKRTNIRWVYIVIGISWLETTMSTDVASHLGMLVVDTVAETYSYFDPGLGITNIVDTLQPTSHRIINFYDVFCRNRSIHFIPGYKCLDQRQEDASLQSVVDTTTQIKQEDPDAVVPSGLCAIVTLLVLVCCRRFQSGNPWTIANSIKRIFVHTDATQQENFRINITSWYTNIYYANHWKEVARLLWLCNVPVRDQMCGVLDATNTMYCPSNACNGNTLCEQHYYDLVLQALSHQEHFPCYITHDVLKLRGQFPTEMDST
jgi:hypothetical protein